LPELLNEIAGKPVQIEVPAVRILFELLGFLLSQVLHISRRISAKIKIKNQESTTDRSATTGPFRAGPNRVRLQSPQYFRASFAEEEDSLWVY
jgi:hypothetical protein